MPAHLESTNRAMKAEKARIGQDRRARMEDQDNDRDMISDDVASSSASPRNRWRARMNAAVTLKQKKKTFDSDEKAGSEN